MDAKYLIMKTTLKIVLSFFLLYTIACSSDTTSDSSVVAETIDGMEALDSETEAEEENALEKEEAAAPARDKEELKIIDDQIKNSPFYALGCCEQEDQRKRTCCCQEVVKKYEAIRAEGDADLILKVKTEDPIFSGCKRRSKWRKRIEEIEKPPKSEEEEEEGYDF